MKPIHSPAQGKRKRRTASKGSDGVCLSGPRRHAAPPLASKIEYDDDPTIPTDEMFSSMFHGIRGMTPEPAVFWACAIDRKGLGEQLWKCLTIFSFRDIGYAYPEAACFVYNYFCAWLTEMKRYKRELQVRLEYGCTNAVLSLLNTKDTSFGGDDSRAGKRSLQRVGLTQPWVSAFITRGMQSLSSDTASLLLDEIYFYMESMPNDLLPAYETPCGCTALQRRLDRSFRAHSSAGRLSSSAGGEVSSPPAQVDHLTTARHLLINVIQYLCILPTCTLSRDISFFTAFKCIGMLTEGDWNVSLSFPDLEQKLYLVRKDHPQAVQQACICLCASIIHKDERRAIDMTDLFSVWKEEELFWDTLSVMLQVFYSNYQWIQHLLEVYKKAWAWTRDCADYFVDNGRSAMFSAVLLFVRGPPRRNREERVLDPSNISYSTDYAYMFYGPRTPSYASLEFLREKGGKESAAVAEEDRQRIQNVFSVCSAADRLRETGPGVETESTTNPLDVLTHLVQKMVQEFPGRPASSTEPYAVKVRRGRGARGTSHASRASMSLSCSAIRTKMSNVRGMGMSGIPGNPGNPGNGKSSDTVPYDRMGAQRRMYRANREVCVDDNAVDWSTKRGREMGRGVRHAFGISERVPSILPIENEYVDHVEKMLQKQCRKAAKARKERDRLRRMQEQEKRRRLHHDDDPINDDDDDPIIDDINDDINDDSAMSEWTLVPSDTQQPTEGVHQLGCSLEALGNRLKKLSMMPWYDPGLVHLYREVASTMVRAAQRRADHGSGNLEDSLPSFLLNTFSVENNKNTMRTSVLGRDGWLDLLTENLQHTNAATDSGDGTQTDEFSSCTPSADEEESSDVGSVMRAIEGIRLSSFSEDEEESASALSESPSMQEEPPYDVDGPPDRASEEDGSFGEDIYHWQPLSRGLVTVGGGDGAANQDGRLSVAANWADDVLEGCLTLGPFSGKEEAFRIQTGYEILDHLELANTPVQSLLRWVETVRSLMMTRTTDLDNPSQAEQRPKEKAPEDRGDLLQSIMNSMEETKEERKRAFVPLNVLRQQEHQRLLDAASVHEGAFGLENAQGMLVDPLSTWSCSVVCGYEARPGADIQGWTGPYRTKGPRHSRAEPPLSCYLQYRMKIGQLLLPCRTSLWTFSPSPAHQDRLDVDLKSSKSSKSSKPLRESVPRQGAAGRTTFVRTILAQWLDDCFRHDGPCNRVPRFRWTVVPARFCLDSIPYTQGEALFFNMVFCMVFSRYGSVPSILRHEERFAERCCSQLCVEQARGPESGEHMAHRELPGWDVENEEEETLQVKADRMARRVIVAQYALETPLVMIHSSALGALACTRKELVGRHRPSEEAPMSFLSDFKNMVHAKAVEEERNEAPQTGVFWKSLHECACFFLEYGNGQRVVKARLMKWKTALSQWLSDIPEDAKCKMDAMFADEDRCDDFDDFQDVVAVMDYKVVAVVIERLNALMVELDRLPADTAE